MEVTFEGGRLIVAPSSDAEAKALAEWHKLYSESAKPDLFFKVIDETRAGTALILKA
jgi:hypothetical protein